MQPPNGASEDLDVTDVPADTEFEDDGLLENEDDVAAARTQDLEQIDERSRCKGLPILVPRPLGAGCEGPTWLNHISNK